MEQAKHEVGEAGQIPRGSSTASAQDVEDLKTEVRMLRKELQTLNACFNTSAGKLSALMQQQSQAGERLSEQGQQIQACFSSGQLVSSGSSLGVLQHFISFH